MNTDYEEMKSVYAEAKKRLDESWNCSGIDQRFQDFDPESIKNPKWDSFKEAILDYIGGKNGSNFPE